MFSLDVSFVMVKALALFYSFHEFCHFLHKREQCIVKYNKGTTALSKGREGGNERMKGKRQRKEGRKERRKEGRKEGREEGKKEVHKEEVKKEKRKEKKRMRGKEHGGEMEERRGRGLR